MRIVFMGSPEAAVPGLARLLDDGHEIAAVITQPDRPSGRHLHPTPPPIACFAAGRNLRVLQPLKIRTDAFAAEIESLCADLAAVIAYGRILPERLLGVPRLGCVNLHFSLLPKYRGAAPVNWAVVAGESVTGVTTIRMDAGLDTGPILLQREVAIEGEETAPELLERLAGIGASVLSETVSAIARGNVSDHPQDHTRATYAPLIEKQHGFIDWSRDAESIRNLIRGLQPWPCAWTTLAGSAVKLWRALAGPLQSEHADPGSIVAIDHTAIGVACGAGTTLRILEVQRQNQRRMTALDFANGARLKAGDRFHSEIQS